MPCFIKKYKETKKKKNRQREILITLKYYTKNVAGDILLAPQRLGEISIIQLKSSAKYMLRRDAFLAKTEKVTLDLGVHHQQTVKYT